MVFAKRKRATLAVNRFSVSHLFVWGILAVGQFWSWACSGEILSEKFKYDLNGQNRNCHDNDDIHIACLVKCYPNFKLFYESAACSACDKYHVCKQGWIKCCSDATSRARALWAKHGLSEPERAGQRARESQRVPERARVSQRELDSAPDSVLSRNVKIRYFLSQNVEICAMSRKMA